MRRNRGPHGGRFGGVLARRWSVLLACALALVVAGCGGDEESAKTDTVYDSDFTTGPVTIDSRELGRIYGYPRIKEAAKLAAEPNGGRRVVLASGCLACHQIGPDGSSGPGNNLDGIGARRTRAEIRRAIVSPRGTVMPPYAELPRRMLDALVSYLATLRGAATGGTACSADADCG